MKTQPLTIRVAPEEARAYQTASPEVQQEIDRLLRGKLREALRSGFEHRIDAVSDADPDAVADRILSFLSDDRYQTARLMAAEAIRRFPEHPRLRQVWGIFDTHGKATVAAAGPEPSRRADFDWLRQAPENLRGQWVALVDGALVSCAETLEKLTASLKGKTFSRTPLVHRVD